MNVKNAESLGGKRFEALIGVAQEVQERLDELYRLEEYGSFEHSSFNVNGEDFEIGANLRVTDAKGFRALIDFVSRRGVEVDRVLTQGAGARIAITVNPRKWKSTGVCHPCIEHGVT